MLSTEDDIYRRGQFIYAQTFTVDEIITFKLNVK